MTRRRLAPDDPRRPLLMAWWEWDHHPAYTDRIATLEVQVKNAAAALDVSPLELRKAMATAKREGHDYIDALDEAARSLGLDPSRLLDIPSTPVDPPTPRRSP